MFAVDIHGRIAVLHPRPAFAAHSMDTDWYGVDRQGRVGLWRSNEEGAVPYLAHRQPWDELCIDLAVAYALSLPPERSSSSSKSEPGRLLVVDHRARIVGLRELPASWTGVLQFTCAEYLEMFQADWAHCVERTLTTAEHALEVRHMFPEAFYEYWNAGAIRVACAFPSIITPSALGFYEYACGFSGPYARRAVPKHHLLVGDLPPALRELLSALQLGLDFDSTDSFDPLSKLDCQTYR